MYCVAMIDHFPTADLETSVTSFIQHVNMMAGWLMALYNSCGLSYHLSISEYIRCSRSDCPYLHTAPKKIATSVSPFPVIPTTGSLIWKL